jgi:hypothetical protein
MLTAIIRTGTKIMMVWLILISFQNAVSSAEATEHQTQMKYNNECQVSSNWNRTILCEISSLMMEAVRTSETSVDNHFTRQYIPEDNSEQNNPVVLLYRHESAKPFKQQRC